MFYLFRFDSVSLPEKENKIRGGKSTNSRRHSTTLHMYMYTYTDTHVHVF